MEKKHDPLVKRSKRIKEKTRQVRNRRFCAILLQGWRKIYGKEGSHEGT